MFTFVKLYREPTSIRATAMQRDLTFYEVAVELEMQRILASSNIHCLLLVQLQNPIISVYFKPVEIGKWSLIALTGNCVNFFGQPVLVRFIRSRIINLRHVKTDVTKNDIIY